jgi:valyl-tRNA synthetase
VADAWILSRLADLSAAVDEGIDAYEFGEVSRALYDFFWNEFCDWYIELSKPRLFAGTREDADGAEKAARLRPSETSSSCSIPHCGCSTR